MNIKMLFGEVKMLIQLTVFDCVPAATVKVAGATIFARGVAYTLCGSFKVNGFKRIAVFAFTVKVAVCMAGETIDVFRVLEVEICIFPAIANVAGGAFLLVALRANTEVVDLILLTDGYCFFSPGN